MPCRLKLLSILIKLNTDSRLQLDVLRFQSNAMRHLFLYVLDEGNTLKKNTTYSKEIYIYSYIYVRVMVENLHFIYRDFLVKMSSSKPQTFMYINLSTTVTEYSLCILIICV